MFSDLGSQGACTGDVLGLRGLVAATQQHDDGCLPSHEVQAVSGPDMDPRLGDAPADAVSVAEVPEPQGSQARGDSRLRPVVAEPGEPLGEHLGLEDADHMVERIRSDTE